MKVFAHGHRFVLAFIIAAFFPFAATAQTTNALSESEIKGRELAQKILEQRPTENSTTTGVLQFRDGNDHRTNYWLKCEIAVTATNWATIYTSSAMKPWIETLSIIHSDSQPEEILHYAASTVSRIPLAQDEFSSFANSDFWLCDLGLEFFHWPEQKVLRHEFRRTRGCDVLQSTNPNPSPGEYSKVISWIDDETFGIVHAEAYDANGKLLKAFDPKEFKKINGQWMLQEMEIRNVQTGSRTRMEFDLPEKKS